MPVGGGAMTPPTGVLARDRHPVARANPFFERYARRQDLVAGGGSAGSRAVLPARSPLATHKVAS
jgi:hypothetical protein